MTDSFTVYIVDDDAAVRVSLQAMLEANGYKTQSFSTGSAFLDAGLSDMQGCALLDVRMPDINGLDLQETINTKGIGLPVIIMTGHGDIQMAVRAMKAGAVEFIEKPFTKESIVESVENAKSIKRKLNQTSGGQVDPDIQLRFEKLTPREREILIQLVIGNPYKIVAHELDISPRTVEIHRARVMEKMQAKNLSQLVRMAIAIGVDPE